MVIHFIFYFMSKPGLSYRCTIGLPRAYRFISNGYQVPNKNCRCFLSLSQGTFTTGTCTCTKLRVLPVQKFMLLTNRRAQHMAPIPGAKDVLGGGVLLVPTLHEDNCFTTSLCFFLHLMLVSSHRTLCFRIHSQKEKGLSVAGLAPFLANKVALSPALTYYLSIPDVDLYIYIYKPLVDPGGQVHSLGSTIVYYVNDQVRHIPSPVNSSLLILGTAHPHTHLPAIGEDIGHLAHVDFPESKVRRTNLNNSSCIAARFSSKSHCCSTFVQNKDRLFFKTNIHSNTSPHLTVPTHIVTFHAAIH